LGCSCLLLEMSTARLAVCIEFSNERSHSEWREPVR
jgi:hypothetical protein